MRNQELWLSLGEGSTRGAQWNLRVVEKATLLKGTDYGFQKGVGKNSTRYNPIYYNEGKINSGRPITQNQREDGTYISFPVLLNKRAVNLFCVVFFKFSSIIFENLTVYVEISILNLILRILLKCNFSFELFLVCPVWPYWRERTKANKGMKLNTSLIRENGPNPQKVMSRLFGRYYCLYRISVIKL